MPVFALDPFAEPAPEGKITMVAYDVRKTGIDRFNSGAL
jgi:hypothetical protein